MEKFDTIYILLVIATIVVLFFGLLIAKNGKKKQIHYAVLGMTISLLTWDLAVLLYLTFENTRWYSVIYEQMYFLSTIFVSITILFTGLIYAKTRIKFTLKHSLLFIVPAISVVMLFTNQYHHLFYTKFSLTPSRNIHGIYFTIHTTYSYMCIGIGLFYLGLFSIKNFGFFSKQSLLIFLGILIALIFDSFSTFKIFDWSAATENISFAISTSCFIFAIIKFDFLKLIPIALQTIVDLISDGYVVINEYYEIIDYNRTFADTFSGILNFKRKDTIFEFIRNVGYDDRKFVNFVEEAVSEQKKVSFEIQRQINKETSYYLVEVIPIFVSGDHIGTIILVKNITEQKNYLEQVEFLNKRLKNLAIKDGLTQAYNRYFFDERLQQEIDRVSKQQIYGQDIYKRADNFGIVMFDIDFFKSYNDNNGHLAGDELLQIIVKIIKEGLFSTDILCRYGGEEFVVICCKTSAKGLAITAEKIRKTVESYNFRFQEKQPNGNLTISVGTAYCSMSDMKKDDLIRKADENLFLAKNGGRNRVVAND